MESLSNLPPDVVGNILACLPLRTAVRTCILSREWRYKWTSIPQIDFNFSFDQTLMWNQNHKLEMVVHHVLLHHRGPIHKFALQVPSYISGPDIDNWIFLLSRHRVQELTLHLFQGGKHRLGSHFYDFQHLRHLKLYRCVFEPPSQFKGFRKLVTLDCQDVFIVPEVFAQFISHCPLLESLRLVGCTNWDSFEIEGPSLRFLTFHGVFNSIRFKNCPVLAEVSLSTPLLRFRSLQSYSFKHFEFLPTLEKLHLHPRLLQLLGAGNLPDRFHRSLNRLRVLNFSMYLDNVQEVNSALCLIRSSPNLQFLRVTLYDHGTVEEVIDFIRAQETEDCHLKQVRKVEIAVFSSTKPQLELARYLLASAAGLEEMVIYPTYRHNDAVLSFIDQLTQMPRASPKALISVRR